MPKIIINKGCRICFKKTTDLVDIDEEDGSNLKISHYDKLVTFVPEMKNIKTASRKICKNCMVELNSAYNFYKKCLNSLKPPELKVVLTRFDVKIPDKNLNEQNNNLNGLEENSTRRNDIVLSPNLNEILRFDGFGIESPKNSWTPRVLVENPSRSVSPKKNSTITTTIDLVENIDVKKCVMCNQEFPNVEKLEIHVKNIHAVRNLLEFDSYNDMKRLTDKDTLKFITNVTNRVNKRASMYERVKITKLNDSVAENTGFHIGDTRSEMSNETVDLLSLKENNLDHIETESTGSKRKKKKYECLYCGKTLDTKVNFTRHMQLHEISVATKKDFKCKYCKQSFNDLTRLSLHIKIHENKEIFQCHICLTVCSSQKSLKAHMHVHDKKRKSDPGYLPHRNGGFTCSKCDVTLATRGSMKLHMATHKSEKPHKCQHCSSEFKTRPSLVQHLALMHAPVNFPCTVCDRSFAYKYALLQHLATHTKDQKI